MSTPEPPSEWQERCWSLHANAHPTSPLADLHRAYLALRTRAEKAEGELATAIKLLTWFAEIELGRVRELEGMVAMLRDVLGRFHIHVTTRNDAFDCRDSVSCAASQALTNTQATADTFVEAVRAPLEAQIAALRDGLDKFGDHAGSGERDMETLIQEGCAIVLAYANDENWENVDCNCGYAALLMGSESAATSHDAEVARRERERVIKAIRQVYRDWLSFKDEPMITKLDRAIAELEKP